MQCHFQKNHEVNKLQPQLCRQYNERPLFAVLADPRVKVQDELTNFHAQACAGHCCHVQYHLQDQRALIHQRR